LFTDDDGSGFEGDIDRLGTAGVTRGCNPPDNDRFCPRSPVTRGAMAAFLHRALDGTTPSPDPKVGIELNKLPDWPEDGSGDYDKKDGAAEIVIEAIDDTNYVCENQDMDLKSSAEEVVTFDLSSEFLWPGVLIQGGAFEVGSIKELPIRQRAPLPIFVDFSNKDIRRVIDKPTPGAIASAVGDVIEVAEGSDYEPATNVYFTQTNTYDSSQMALHLGLSARYMSTKVKSTLDMARDASKNTVTVYFKETAFSANVDGLPQNPGAFFSSEFTPELLAEQEQLGRISATNLPVYVSNITYGRILMYSLTSTASHTEIQSAISGVSKFASGSVSAEAKAKYAALMSKSTYELVTVGGSSASAAAAIESGDFTKYFTDSPPLTAYTPISYVLRDLKGNIAYLGETTDYTIETCEASNCRNGEDYDLAAWWDASSQPSGSGHEAIDIWTADGYSSDALMIGHDPLDADHDMVTQAQHPGGPAADDVFRLNWADGQSDMYASAPNDASLAPANQTKLILSAWVNWHGPQTGQDWQTILIKGPNRDTATFSLEVKNDGSLRAGIYRYVYEKCWGTWGTDDNTCADPGYGHDLEQVATVPGSLQVDEWMHVAVTFDKDTSRLAIHLNGDKVAEVNTDRYWWTGLTDENKRQKQTQWLQSNTDPVEIGGDGTAAAFRGLIDDVQIATGAMDATDLGMLAENGYCPVAP
ncbi:MAG: thiol-activated cytolysin family protein, partial [Acidimicrobiia bacterium]